MNYYSFMDCYRLLTYRQKKEWFIVLFFSLLASFLEIAGVATVIPVISLLVDYQSNLNGTFFSIIHRILGEPEKIKFIFTIAALSASVILVSMIITVANLYLQNRYSRRVIAELSARLFKGYLNTPLEYFQARTSADLLRSINDLTSGIVHNIIINIIHLISKIWLLLIISVLLVLVNTIISIFIICTITVSYYIIFRYVRVYTISKSKENFELHKLLHQMIINAANSIKYIKVDQLVDQIVSSYQTIKKLQARQEANIEIVGAIPRYFIEAIGMISLLVVALYIGLQEESTNSIVSKMVFFAVAAYRVLPSAQQIYHGINRLVGSINVFNELKSEWINVLNIESRKDHTCKFSGNTIKLSAISYSYPNLEKNVIEKLSLDIPLAGILLLDGASGMGKSTLLELIIGLRFPQQGNILIDDHLLSPSNVNQWWKLISYCDQNTVLSGTTIHENIVGNQIFNLSLFKKILKICEINENEYNKKTCFFEASKSLSGGEKARVSIARTLYKPSNIVILDEVFSSLDVSTAKRILNAMICNFPKRCFIIVSHRKEELLKVDYKINLS